MRHDDQVRTGTLREGENLVEASDNLCVPVELGLGAGESRCSGMLTVVLLILLDGLDRAHDVDEPGPLEVAHPSEIGCGRSEYAFDLFGLADELRSDREERRDGAPDICGGSRSG